MSASGPLSRRAALKAIGLSVTGAATCALAGNAQALAQLTPAVAGYQDHPNGNDQCGTCPYFQAPNMCRVVSGPIAVNGWCQLYTPFSLDAIITSGG